MDLYTRTFSWLKTIAKSGKYLKPSFRIQPKLVGKIKLKYFRDVTFELELDDFINYLADNDSYKLLFWSLFAKQLDQIAYNNSVLNDLHNDSDKSVKQNDWTPLMMTARFSDKLPISKSVLSILISRSSNLDIQSSKNGWTALMLTSRYNNNVEIGKALIDAGANLDLQNKDGWTALMLMSRYNNNVEIGKTLIDAGANLDLRNRSGCSVLELATSNEVVTIIYKEKMEKYKCVVKIAKNMHISDSDLERHRNVIDALKPFRLNESCISLQEFDYDLDIIVGSNNYWYLLTELKQLKDDRCPYTRTPLDQIRIVYSLLGSNIPSCLGNR